MPHLSRAARGAALSWPRDVNAARKIPSVYVSPASEGRDGGRLAAFFSRGKENPTTQRRAPTMRSAPQTNNRPRTASQRGASRRNRRRRTCGCLAASFELMLVKNADVSESPEAGPPRRRAWRITSMAYFTDDQRSWLFTTTDVPGKTPQERFRALAKEALERERSNELCASHDVFPLYRASWFGSTTTYAHLLRRHAAAVDALAKTIDKEQKRQLKRQRHF